MEKCCLTDAFKALQTLDEDVFNINDEGEIKAAQDLIDTDVEPMTQVIDPLAETEEELEDSYLNKVILDCTICQSKIYKDPEEVVIDEESGLANTQDICPFCQSTGDGFKVIGQVAKYEPKEKEEVKVEVEDKEEVEESLNNKNLTEDIENLTLETDKEKITVTSEKKDDEEEVIAPIAPETEKEFKDVDIDEFDEESFDELGESYLKNVYENVKSYKTESGKFLGNKLMLEGVITFKSGKQGKTRFMFESKSVNSNGDILFEGFNKQFARGPKAFKLIGKAEGSKYVVESLKYNYKVTDSNGKSRRIYNTVNR